MERTHFDDFLTLASQQREPQRLLFVFAAAQLPDEHTEDEAQRFAQGQGGTLSPIMYVDKALHEVANFDALRNESRQMGREWQIVFVGALDGHNGVMLSTEQAEQPLELMVKQIGRAHV